MTKYTIEIKLKKVAANSYNAVIETFEGKKAQEKLDELRELINEHKVVGLGNFIVPVENIAFIECNEVEEPKQNYSEMTKEELERGK